MGVPPEGAPRPFWLWLQVVHTGRYIELYDAPADEDHVLALWLLTHPDSPSITNMAANYIRQIADDIQFIRASLPGGQNVGPA